jgi:hypothetical protein
MAQRGEIGWDKRNGHRLKGKFRDLFMMRAGHDHEFFGFRHEFAFYVTNGAPKRTPEKKQVQDYELSLRIRTEFFGSLEL